MVAKLIAPTDSIEVKQLCCLLYGQPGSRKSSLAQTADEPITLAFDPGIYRAYGRKFAVVFDTWDDVLAFDLSPYKTIIADTVGMLLDKLSLAIIGENPKNGNRLGGLSLPGYGVLATRFAAWVTSIRERGQHLVFLAHEKAERLGDESYYCPDIVGKSYNTLMNHSDIVGYMHFANGARVIDFNPTDRWMAKTPPCGWGTKPLPDFAQDPHFLSRLLEEARLSMGRISAASSELAKALEDFNAKLAADPDLKTFNAMYKEVSGMKAGAEKNQKADAMKRHAKAAGLEFNKASKVFEQKAEPAAV